MVKLEFLGPISCAIDNCEIEATTLEDVISFIKAQKELESWIDDLALAINDKIIQNSLDNKNISLSDGDKISVLPPVCGG